MLAPKLFAPLQIPRLVPADPALSRQWEAPCFVVVAPGEAAGVELRPGDLLVAGPAPRPGEVVLLAPRGRGRPMLGRLTARGLVAEPGGVPCSPDRWQVVGRVGARVRPQPRGGGPRVLHFPTDAEPGQEALPLGGGDGGLALALKVSGEADRALIALLSGRFSGLRQHAGGLLTASCGPAFSRAPMELAESLVVELRRRFGVDVSAAVAPDPELALAVVRRLDAGAAAYSRALPGAAPCAAAPPPAPQDTQLALWG